MTGVKGKSGGKRQGAGRPTSKNTIRVGDSFAAVRHYPNGQVELLPVVTVSEVKSNLIVITLADGGSIRLAK